MTYIGRVFFALSLSTIIITKSTLMAKGMTDFTFELMVKPAGRTSVVELSTVEASYFTLFICVRVSIAGVISGCK